jgi:hypothetical protein
VALQVVVLTSFTIMAAYACEFFLIVSFWTGALIGVAVYGAIILISCFAEDD